MLGCALALTLAVVPAQAFAQPTLSVTQNCAYSGERFALNGNGLDRTPS